MALSEVGELLADVVVPIGYAVRGAGLADDLRAYKSEWAGPATAAAAADRLRQMLAAFLRGPGNAAWAAAGMAAGPGAVAVVPSGQGRAGSHPLTRIVRSSVELPLIGLSVAGREAHGRGINPNWVRVGDRVVDTDVLVIDDTWVSGGSAQSVAVALKLAGARRVAIVVLGRHVNPDDSKSSAFLRAVLSPDAEQVGGGGGADGGGEGR